ncbi:hypothetical protein D9756_003571 [Leucocoprinus leucothites]|uniref:Uncharacterized protein n=1 Tax=Leucocoprinus leucothites TaxID=201217 RepID=A0A8H5G7M6_9AGAR|nr:hypothetical protein D9756_003571 [Leucoagaricus leucothites]
MASHTDIERELYTLFTDHPSSNVNDSGEPVIPADALVDVLSALTDVSSVPLLSDEENAMLKALLENNPGLEVTPSILLQFIAEKTRNSPSPSPDHQDDSQQRQLSPEADSPSRGRDQERQYSGDSYHRSSSNESNSASYYSGSRPPSRGPLGRSPFDMERRQRTTPLNAAPSSWSSAKRPAPASRRRSIDGSTGRPDSEFSVSPSSFSRSTSGTIRTRTPSNPASPSSAYADLGGSFSPIGSPTFSHSYPRPLSRSGSTSASAYNQSFGSIFSPGSGPGVNLGDESLDDETVVTNALLNTSGEYRSDESFNAGISSLPMPSSSLSDSDSDDEQDSSLVLDRNIASSTASMEPLERLEALQRQNTDLGRKLMEAERTLQNRLAEHESELEEMQGKLEEMRSELSATKREEKELRSKERQNTTQISALELEVSKITKALESAKSTYTSLQRQYQEQCTFSEKYRSDLRAREETIRTLREAASLHELESNKWAREQQSYEERIAHLEEELGVAQGVYVQLDEQKQENMLLKETIDRMRFEMDEMRANAALGLPPGGGGAGGSGPGSLSKTLGAELMGKMQWEGEGDDEGAGGQEVEESLDEGSSLEVPERSEDESVTAVEDDEDTEDEDVIQTIITRKKRKVASRAKELPHPSGKKSHTFQERTSGIEQEHSINLEELKEYSDIAIQYDPTLVCVSSGVQTLPPPITPTSTIGIQITPPEIPIRTFAIQTDPPPASPKKVTIEMEIQTETIAEEEDHTAATTTGTATPVQGEGIESLASSSSTILPPTPKAHARTLSSEDEPPTYNQVAAQRAEEEKERRIVNEALARWHVGAKLRSLVASTIDHTHTHLHKRRTGEEEEEAAGAEDDGVQVEPIEGGVAEDLAEEWKALKEELGVECLVIDKILEQSTKIPRNAVANPSSSSATAADDAKGKRRSGRFFNIYNTYVYGSADGSTPSTSSPSSSGQKSFSTTLTNLATQTLLFASASAVVFVALTPYLLSTLSPLANIPGGPNGYDRAAWASFNALGGGGGEGIAFAPRAAAAAGWLPFGGGHAFDGGLGGAGAGGGMAGNGQATEAVWRVLERVGGGAARMARGWPT